MNPISDRFAWVSTYNYAENSPVANIDLHGLQAFGFQLMWNNALHQRSASEQKQMQQGFAIGAGEMAKLTDANDVAVLASTLTGNPRNIDGSKAGAMDVVFAAIGIFLPIISGSGASKIVKELISTEPGMQNAEIVSDIAKDLKSANSQEQFDKMFLGTEGPAKLIDDPLDGATYILDGHHRLTAAEKAGTEFSVPTQTIKLEDQNRFKSFQEIRDAANNKTFLNGN